MLSWERFIVAVLLSTTRIAGFFIDLIFCKQVDIQERKNLDLTFWSGPARLRYRNLSQ